MNFALLDFHADLFRDWTVATTRRTTLVRSGPRRKPRSWLAGLEARLWLSRQNALERRLAGCGDAVELETRLRELERIPPHRRYE